MRFSHLTRLTIAPSVLFAFLACSEDAGLDSLATGGTSSGTGGVADPGGSTGGESSSGGNVSTGGAASGGVTSTGGESSQSGGGPGLPVEPRTRVIGYMPNWYGSYSSWASKVDFSRLTHVNLAFALANDQGKLGLAPAGEIDAFIAAAHAAGVKVYPSLCGGGGDPKITPFYEPDKVDAFVDEIIAFTQARDMDGIDVDVEAPQKMGAKYDTFIAKLIAQAHPLGLEVTAAVAPWMQHGMSDTTVRAFDFITVMSYDNAGTWTGAGAHSSYDQAVDALEFYEAKGVDKDKIVLGVPFYGYCWGSCNGASSRYMLYKDILAKFSWAATTDWIDQDGAKYSFNGVQTMADKAELGQKYGGLMIWELAGDVSTDDDNSLLRALDEAL